MKIRQKATQVVLAGLTLGQTLSPICAFAESYRSSAREPRSVAPSEYNGSKFGYGVLGTFGGFLAGGLLVAAGGALGRNGHDGASFWALMSAPVAMIAIPAWAISATGEAHGQDGSFSSAAGGVALGYLAGFSATALLLYSSMNATNCHEICDLIAIAPMVTFPALIGTSFFNDSVRENQVSFNITVDKKTRAMGPGLGVKF